MHRITWSNLTLQETEDYRICGTRTPQIQVNLSEYIYILLISHKGRYEAKLFRRTKNLRLHNLLPLKVKLNKIHSIFQINFEGGHIPIKNN